ncbi:MAG: AmmeMemoRadiSam system protein A [Planctomycetota bacterium]
MSEFNPTEQEKNVETHRPEEAEADSEKDANSEAQKDTSKTPDDRSSNETRRSETAAAKASAASAASTAPDGVNEDLIDELTDPRRANANRDPGLQTHLGEPTSQHLPPVTPPGGAGGGFDGEMIDRGIAKAQTGSGVGGPSPAPGSVPPRLTDEEKQTLIRVAYAAVESGVMHGRPLEFDPASYPVRLQMHEATFVTLRRSTGELIGCIGSLEPRRPLVADIARNAWAAGFEDPRSPGISRAMLSDVRISISRLTPAVPIPVGTEEELLAELHPGEDGVVLRDGNRRSTFLPAVWDSLPDPRDFIAHLKRKAGLRDDYWSDSIRFERYGVVTIP